MNDRLVLCLGNEILSDDGLGYVVAQRLRQSDIPLDVDIETASLAGFALLDLLKNRREVLIIDAIQTFAVKPGTIREFSADILAPTVNLVGSHQINLPTALELGRMCGMTMPDRIDIIAVEAADIQTLHEGLTPAIAEAVPEVLLRVRRWIARVPPVSQASTPKAIDHSRCQQSCR